MLGAESDCAAADPGNCYLLRWYELILDARMQYPPRIHQSSQHDTKLHRSNVSRG